MIPNQVTIAIIPYYIVEGVAYDINTREYTWKIFIIESGVWATENNAPYFTEKPEKFHAPFDEYFEYTFPKVEYPAGATSTNATNPKCKWNQVDIYNCQTCQIQFVKVSADTYALQGRFPMYRMDITSATGYGSSNRTENERE